MISKRNKRYQGIRIYAHFLPLNITYLNLPTFQIINDSAKPIPRIHALAASNIALLPLFIFISKSLLTSMYLYVCWCVEVLGGRQPTFLLCLVVCLRVVCESTAQAR